MVYASKTLETVCAKGKKCWLPVIVKTCKKDVSHAMLNKKKSLMHLPKISAQVNLNTSHMLIWVYNICYCSVFMVNKEAFYLIGQLVIRLDRIYYL